MVGAILAVDALATLFCIFGWVGGNLSEYVSDPVTHNHLIRPNNWTDVVTVVVIWAYAIGVTIVIAIVYFLLNQIPALNDLGRKNRNVRDTHLENVIAALQKLALEHEVDAHGKSRYVIAQKAAEEEDE